ncbi:MAG: shikimate kinase [Lachnobacterium sp.]|nr:shikimate kinase [Lachnobacterium sp.]MCI7531814.1 shikimate kinase [Lachnobacterium sp.]MDD7713997.1 shikimate kinase [Lachnobacterium sp.]MDY5461113.1 shikimate kinase [Agathobacter sp.]
MSKGINCNIFLIGFMGAGKSTIARTLQRELGFPLVEMDERIVQEQGMSINDIFAQYGEAHFREIESQLVVDLGKQEPSIVSCGGGVVVRPENTQNMKKSGRIVLLKASPETIFERVKNSTDRPILNGHMNVEYIAELMEKRRALYEEAADITIQTDGKTREQICEEIIGKLRDTNEV